MSRIDTAANRRTRKWSRTELAGRLLWAFASPLFRLTPRPLWGLRRGMLRIFGAKIGEQVHVYPTVRIAIPWTLSIGANSAVGDRAILYGLGAIQIGSHVTISQGAHLCAGTHDWRDPSMSLIKSLIEIKDDVWICAEAFIGPDVTVGERSIVSARACLMRDLDADRIAHGNPAQIRPKPYVRLHPK